MPLELEERFSADLISAVGLVFLTSGYGETVLALHLARLVAHPQKIDPAVTMALAGATTSVNLQQIKILARFRLAPEQAAEVIDLCDKIRDSYQRRNEVAHFVILPGKTPDKAILRTLKLKADGTLVPEKPYTAAQIREFAETLHGRLVKLDKLLTAAGLAKLGDTVSSLTASPPAAG